MKKAGICLSDRIHRAHARMYIAGPLILLSLSLAAQLTPLTHAQTDTSWKITSGMKNVRRLHTATLLPDGRVLVAGGLSGSTGENTPTTTAEIYDPATRTWRPTGSLNFARSSHTATLLANGQVLVVGGVNNSQSPAFTMTDSAELYDPITETWNGTGRLSGARAFHTSTLLPNGRVLVAGGLADSFEILRTAEIYDPMTGLWSATRSLNMPRWLHTATLLPGGKVLVAAGSKGDFPFLSSAELYDPATGIWTPTGHLNSPDHYTAVLLANGKVLVAEGQNSESELYDAVTETWTITGKPESIREQGYSATVLPTGKVLLAGGYNYDSLVGTEIYDPTAGIWNNSGRLNTPRYGHSATLLSNGTVLVAGGVTQSSNPTLLNSAELFDGSAPDVTGIHFDPIAVETGSAFFAALSGADVSDTKWFDVRFRDPLSTTDQVALNWQRGSVTLHSLTTDTIVGVYTVTGIRPHIDQDDHTGPFNSVHATITVLRP